MADRLPVDVDGFREIFDRAVKAWSLSERGQIDESIAAYATIDGLLPQGTAMDGSLSVLRQNDGIAYAPHTVRPVEPTEDRVVTFLIGDGATQGQTDILASEPGIDLRGLSRGIRTVMDAYDTGLHGRNASGEGRHIMVMSTGRCGTMSLYRLFSQHPLLLAYHTFWWGMSVSYRMEMLCRIMSANPGQGLGDLWAMTRAAEWLGAEANGRVMVDLNHLDTIFAPIFAAIHPRSRFIHLRRDPAMVFDSFFAKNQWMNAQLQPATWTFAGGFHWSPVGGTLQRRIAWYIRLTEVFARAMGQVVGPERYIEVSSDRLFAQDVDEIARLSDFVGVAIDPEHFASRINAKDHKVCVTDRDLDYARQEFLRAYTMFGGDS